MWIHYCKAKGGARNIIESNEYCQWCGLSESQSKQLNDGHDEYITDDKQFLQEINKHGQ
jgi:hypothetical protein